MNWLRFYVSTLDNPKVQRLPDALFRAWVNLLCVARKHDGLIPGNVDDVAFALRSTAGKVQAAITKLVEARLLEPADDGWRPHDWDEHQYTSDSSAARVKRHREKARNAAPAVTATAPACDGAVAATPPESEPESEAESETESDRETEQTGPARVPRAGPQGLRLSSDWQPDPALVAWAEAELPHLDWRAETAAFRDYWIAQAGARGRKSDWPAT
jgi:hypothetical protein